MIRLRLPSYLLLPPQEGPPHWEGSTIFRKQCHHHVNEWSLETDDDICMLLDGEDGQRPALAPAVACSAGARKAVAVKNGVRRRPETASARGRLPLPHNTVLKRMTGRRPHTAGGGGARHRGQGESGKHTSVVLNEGQFQVKRGSIQQLRRDMLLRSRGFGHAMGYFADEPFEATAMGRRVPRRRTQGDHEVS